MIFELLAQLGDAVRGAAKTAFGADLGPAKAAWRELAAALL